MRSICSVCRPTRPFPPCRRSSCRVPRGRPISCWKCSAAGATSPSCWTSSAGRPAWSRSRTCSATWCRRSSNRGNRPPPTRRPSGSSSWREAPRPAGSRRRWASRWPRAGSRRWPGCSCRRWAAFRDRGSASRSTGSSSTFSPPRPPAWSASRSGRGRCGPCRSIAPRGAQGGLATTTEEVADLLEAFGFERVLLETVGVGQTELDIARSAETTVLVLVPESGDGIQALKAGVMEIADIYVVNKSDRPGADKFRQEVEVMLGLRRGNAFRHISPHHAARPRADSATGGRADRAGPLSDGPTVPPSDLWEPPVLATAATTGTGVDELAAALDRHYAYLQASGTLAERRRQRLAARTRAVLERKLRRWLLEATRVEELLALRLDEVADGRRSPYDVAAEILDQVKAGEGGDATR